MKRPKLQKDQIFYLDPYSKNENVIALIHGLGSDSSSWQLQMDVLASQGFRPIAIDIPGFGNSRFSFRHWSIRRAALMISQQIIDPLEKPVIFIGLSLGGVIAQKILEYRPQKIKKIVLVSTFSRLHPKVKKNLPYLGRRVVQVFSGNIRKQAKTVADRIFPLPDQLIWHDYLLSQVKHANPKIYRQAMIGLSAFNSKRWIKNTGIPCLVVTGSDDSTVTIQDQNRLAKIIPGAKHITIVGGGHAVNVDHYQEFNQKLIQFLNE